ncbi:MAG: hypothetical protein H0X36_03760 [Sphingomonadaceae bacterium]|nr:hypothetical protein [Sphingomonadaceae bacterium]
MSPEGDATEFAQLTIQQRIVIRIPARPVPAAPARPLRWKEKHGPKCLPLAMLAGAVITGPQQVDLFMRGGARMRAVLDDECPAIDFYEGFYLTPTRDGRVCADRDMIHTRIGGQCAIERFRTLVPDR